MKPIGGALGGLALVAALVVLWVFNCSGPRPSVSDVRLIEPRSAGDPYRLEATVRNDGRGHGQVDLIFQLRDRASGRVVQEEQKAILEPDETTLAVAEILAPPGDYTPEVEAQYPPG